MDFNSAAKFDKITKAIEEMNTRGNNNQDDRFWQPQVDSAGNGYAVIRFLPTPEVDGEDALPWVKFLSYGFQGKTGKWYIENSPRTIEMPDPVTELNNKLWNG